MTFMDHEVRLFSPSGRYILFEIYSRERDASKYCKETAHLFPVWNIATGIAPLLTIADFSNRMKVVYANKKVISDRAVESVNAMTYILNSYWISDVQLICVYVKNECQIVQCLYTINHEKRTYEEEVYEYNELEDEIINNFWTRNRNTVNPLFIGNEAYFTVMVNYNFYMFPWMPSNKSKNSFKKIKLNKDDALLNKKYHDLKMEDNTFYFNYGHRAFFFVRWEYDEITCHSFKLASIDFSKHRIINLSEGVELPFDIVEFTILDSNVLVDVFADNYQFTCHGRYILYKKSVDGEDEYNYESSNVYDLQNMTIDIIDDYWVMQPLMYSNSVFNIGFYTKEFDLAHLEQPGIKSLVNICRKKLIYSKKKIEVPKKLLGIIFPSP